MSPELEPILSACLHQVDEPLFIIDSAGNCIYVNEAFARFLGHASLPKGTWRTNDFWPEAQTLSKPSGEFHAKFLSVDRREIQVRLSYSEITKQLWLVRVLAWRFKGDASEYLHSDRLKTLGVLAGGIAHDFNNILAGILGHITYLRTVLPSAGAHAESLAAVEEGARRASSMTQQILNFSKLDDEEKAVQVELGDLVARMCKLLRGAISPDFSLQCNILSEPVTVLAGEAKLAQIVANLVINARDALSRGGRIEVAVQRVRDQELIRGVFCGGDLSSHEYGVLSVRDNGMGMSHEVQARIFEPYFSTKKDKGTGLGLATVNEIVQQFGGVITVKSEIGKGSELCVYLPLLEVGRAVAARKGQDLTLSGGSERILVVDDEYPVRNVLAMSLAHLGYDVHAVASGIEAIELYTKNAERYSLVILDMIMPQISGEEVFFELKQVDPAVQVILISGYTSEASIERVLMHGGRGFIQKPFTIEELSKRVRETLDSEPCKE